MIVALIFTVVIILLGIWLKMSIKPSENKLNEDLMKELNEKRDVAAQVPLLNQAIESLKDEKIQLLQVHETQQRV